MACKVSSTITLVLANSSCVIFDCLRIFLPNTNAASTSTGNVASINNESFTEVTMMSTVLTTSVTTCRNSSARVSEKVS